MKVTDPWRAIPTQATSHNCARRRIHFAAARWGPGGCDAAPPRSMTTPQKASRTESCMTRASPPSELMVPNVDAVLRSRLGRPRLTVLNRLNTSQRRVAPKRSLTWKVRARLMSKLCQFGPRNWFRTSSPKVPEVTAWNPSVVIQWSTVLGKFVEPTTLGRPVMLVPTLLLLWLTVKGRPERHA